MQKILPYIAVLGVAILLPQIVLAQEVEPQEADYAKQLANPMRGSRAGYTWSGKALSSVAEILHTSTSTLIFG